MWVDWFGWWWFRYKSALASGVVPDGDTYFSMLLNTEDKSDLRTADHYYNKMLSAVC